MVAVLALAACVAPVAQAPTTVEIGGGASLTLPSNPGYPETARVSQLISATYDGAPLRVQSELTLSPNEVIAVLSPLGGPPVMTIRWTAAGVVVDKGPAVPDTLDGQRILADIVLAYWPSTSIQSQLSDGAAFSETSEGRTVRQSGEIIININSHQIDDRETVTIDNLAQKYQLTIVSKRAEP